MSIAGAALLLWRRLRPAAVSGPQRRTPLDDAIEAELQDLLTAERLQGEARTDVHAGAAAAAGRADGR